MVKCKLKLTLRQRATLRALRELQKTDARQDSPWYGMFGANGVGLVTGLSASKTLNDLEILEDLDFVAQCQNCLWRITDTGLGELGDESEDIRHE